MKKLLLSLSLVFFLMIAQGCDLIIIEEDSDEYRALSEEYDAFVERDISKFEDFRDIMNKAANENNTSVFMIKAESKNFFGSITNRTHATGLLISPINDYIFILTLLDDEQEGVSTKYYATDAYGEELSATLYKTDETSNLAILKVRRASQTYETIKFASKFPQNNELVIMISNHFPTQNIIKLGVFEMIEDVPYMKIDSVIEAHGSPVYNVDLEVLGIQLQSSEGLTEIVTYNQIQNFISNNSTK